jgi:serine/threonine protein kinase
LKHENILPMHGFFFDKDRVYLILEYTPGGEIFGELKSQPRGYYSEGQAANIAYQVCKAVQYCHKKDVIHRDIKPENLLRSD